MKILAAIALLAVGAAALSATQDMTPPASLDQHAWLQQLVGEWTVTSETTLEPGAEPVRMESTESVRSIGGVWILGESSASFAGVPFTSILTLGYDPARKAFVGTWIDTMQTHLWSYVGSLDERQTVLTLETEGPSFDDAAKTSRYRDAIELVDKDHKRLTSSVQADDGTWTTFLRAEYRRQG